MKATVLILLSLCFCWSCGGGAAKEQPFEPLDFQSWAEVSGPEDGSGLDALDGPQAPDQDPGETLGDASPGLDAAGLDGLALDNFGELPPLEDSADGVAPDTLPAPEGFQLVVLDVGQGDALLLRFPEGSTMLVDGGPNGAGKWVIAPYLAAAGIDHLDIVVVTHTHSDHVGGLDEVLERVSVGRIWESGDYSETWDWTGFSDLADQLDIKRQVVTRGYKSSLDGCPIKVLNAYEGWGNPNADSVVLRVDCEGKAFLLTGDVTSGAMMDMMDTVKGDLNTDVVKVAHHGSPDSFQGFPEACSAAVAVCSVGEGNPYNHPAADIVAEWEASGAEFHRTDLSGLILVDAVDGLLTVSLPDVEM